MKENDDGRRPRYGILFSVFDDEDGFIRLVIDDMERADSSGQLWKRRWFVTHTNYAREVFIEGSFSDEQLQSFGHGLMGSLRSLLRKKQ